MWQPGLVLTESRLTVESWFYHDAWHNVQQVRLPPLCRGLRRTLVVAVCVRIGKTTTPPAPELPPPPDICGMPEVLLSSKYALIVPCVTAFPFV